MILVTIILFFSFFYISSFCKFDAVEKRNLGLLESISYSLRIMILQRPDPLPSNDLAKLAVTLESIFAPLQAGILALAVRRKFMR